jgi:hypothetical protein
LTTVAAMNDLLPLSQLLFSSWILSAESDAERAAIPSGPGVLDHALRILNDQNELPQLFQGRLHFVESNTGLNCLELPEMQRIATEAKITADPNPSYTRTLVEVGPLVAKRCIARIGISVSEAESFGRALRAAVAKAEEELVSAD